MQCGFCTPGMVRFSVGAVGSACVELRGCSVGLVFRQEWLGALVHPGFEPRFGGIRLCAM